MKVSSELVKNTIPQSILDELNINFDYHQMHIDVVLGKQEPVWSKELC